MPEFRRLPPERRAMRRRIVRNLFILLSFLFAGLWVLTAERTLRGMNGLLDDALKSMIEVMGVAARQSSDLLEAVKSEDVFFELRDLPAGNLIGRSDTLEDDDWLLGDRSWKWVRDHAGENGWDASGNGDALRCWARRITLPEVAGVAAEEDGAATPAGPILLIIGVEREQADRRYLEILIRTGLGFFVALILSLSLTWWIVRRGTRPLQNLASDVEALHPGDLRPVRVPEEPELALVASRLNALLDSVRRSFAREKRFSADVAHELMTPLSGLRTELEVALRKPRSADEWKTNAEHCHGLVLEIQTLVENLLTLARLEAGVMAAEYAVDAREAVERHWGALRAAVAARNVQFENRLSGGLLVLANPAMLDLALGNLLKNVARYTPQGGRAWVEGAEGPPAGGGVQEGAVGAGETAIALRVCNESRPLPEDFAERVFERFWRGDPARTRRGVDANFGPGAGLGLALARSALHAMGSDLTVAVEPGPVVAFTMCLEAASEGKIGLRS